MREFKLPINDERIQSMTEEQIDFTIISLMLDDPVAKKKLENSYYDSDYDEELEKGDEDSPSNLDRNPPAKTSRRSTDDLIIDEDEDEPNIVESSHTRVSEINDWEEVE